MTVAPLGSLGSLPAEGQVPPIFATLDGAPVAVLSLDDYRRLVAAAIGGVGPRPGVAERPSREVSARPVSTVDRDPEVAALLRELIGRHRTVAEMRSACIERFGEARAPSTTRITTFRQRTR